VYASYIYNDFSIFFHQVAPFRETQQHRTPKEEKQKTRKEKESQKFTEKQTERQQNRKRGRRKNRTQREKYDLLLCGSICALIYFPNVRNVTSTSTRHKKTGGAKNRKKTKKQKKKQGKKTRTQKRRERRRRKRAMHTYAFLINYSLSI